MLDWESTAREMHEATRAVLDDTGLLFMETELAAGEWSQALTTGVEAALEAHHALPERLVRDVQTLAATTAFAPDLAEMSRRLEILAA